MDEFGSLILALLFMGSGVAMYLMMEVTLIPILSASRFFILFGLIGFLVAFLLRKQLHISILDGLYYNIFVIAPWCMVAFLGINMLASETYTETHRITDYELHGDRYVFELENAAYEDFWRIRNLQIDTRPARSASVRFTFSNGLLGYKVLRDVELL